MSLRWYAFLCGFCSDVLFTIDHLRSISLFCQNAHHDWLTKEYISNWFLVFPPFFPVLDTLTAIRVYHAIMKRIPSLCVFAVAHGEQVTTTLVSLGIKYRVLWALGRSIFWALYFFTPVLIKRLTRRLWLWQSISPQQESVKKMNTKTLVIRKV